MKKETKYGYECQGEQRHLWNFDKKTCKWICLRCGETKN
jgi:hypothetical protein